MRWEFPVLKSKLDRVSSGIPKLCLRPSADVAPVALAGAVKLTCLRFTAHRRSFTLRFNQRDRSCMLLQGHTDARRITITFPVRSTAAYAAYHKAASCRVGQSTNANGWTG